MATADYGTNGNEVRLYNAELLKLAKHTTDKGVLYKKFTCSALVQNLYWMADKSILLLIQNQTEGKKWRFTYLDLEQSIATGKEQVIKVIDINERADELEGFTFFSNKYLQGIAVTSAKKDNVNSIQCAW